MNVRAVMLRAAAMAVLAGAGIAAGADAPAAGLGAVPAAMQKFVDNGTVSGIVTVVATQDKILEKDAVGVSDLATGRKMEVDDLFWIASMSKPMTAVAVGILKDEGKLSFDDPVEKYLPVFKDVKLADGKAPARAITIHDLLTHTSGMGEYSHSEPHWTLEQFVEQAVSQPLKFEPGTKWSYSTAGLDAAGRVVEVVSGESLDKFMQERIFDPLAMKDTTFWPTAEQMKRYAATYRANRAGGQPGKLEPAGIPYMYGTEVPDRSRAPLGGAGLFSTAEDVTHFYQMVLGGGERAGKRVLKPETVAEMTKVQTGDLTARPGMPWGLGFCVITDPTKMAANDALHAGSYGHGGAYGTNSWVDPTTARIYVMMLELAGQRNPDDSEMHKVFQDVASK